MALNPIQRLVIYPDNKCKEPFFTAPSKKDCYKGTQYKKLITPGICK